MDKKTVVVKLSDRTGVPADDLLKILDELLDLITDTLDNNEEVDLEGFGTFFIEMEGSVSGRDPHSGREQRANPRRRPRFKAGAELSGSVN